MGVTSPSQGGGGSIELLLLREIVRHGEEVIFDNVEADDGSALSVTVAQYIDADLSADGLQFSQPLYQQMLQEAVAHCGEDKLILLTLKVQDGIARVEIEDHGPGIPKDDLPLIWQRYYRTDAPARSVKGSGLGLSIVRGIFDLHGLRYGVRSRLGHGSAFWFEIPVLE